MKLAIAGKGGAGKTTVSAALLRWLAGRGRRVIGVDADPDGNLATALGVPEEAMPSPIAQMRDLIIERTGAEGSGAMFRLNPQVDDLPERFAVPVAGARLLVLGTVEHGGKGCLCSEVALLKALVQHLLLKLPDDVILDMEAGLEHLGRASARGVDAMLTVIEPGMRSVQTAQRIWKLAAEVGIPRVLIVANKVRTEEEREVLGRALGGRPLLGALPYNSELARGDLQGLPSDARDPDFQAAVNCLGEALERELADRGAAPTAPRPAPLPASATP